ncbi:MAG TPA: DNA mismatch repair protein MutL, partial [Verrucomicrobiae bacterium]|nr:DNA mismatch repair protein MutL [Verrucomicrobiae bacterium]
GASVEVRQLFFNLPARRKFLRSEEVEYAHIEHYVMVAALAHPAVAFEFFKDTRAVWQLPAVKTPDKLGALRERLRALTGSEEKLLPVDFSAELPEIAGEEEEETEAAGASAARFAIWGFIGAPGVSRTRRADQHVFVNRRPVENRGINFALLEGYHTALMKGHYPVCTLFIEINAGEVDVNIHPSKREIKFHREKTVRQLVAQAVRETLLKYHATPAVEKPAPKPPPVIESAPEPIALPGFSKAVIDWPAASPPSSLPALPTLPPVVVPAPVVAPLPALTPTPPPVMAQPSPLLRVPLRIVGVIGRLYVVLESDRGLVLLDQHAAHERILFEQMVRRLEGSGPAPSQRLLLPETVELNGRDTQFLREQLPTLTRLGVGLEEFGERTFLLDALPPFVRVGNPRRFILELVDELKAAGQSVNAVRLGEHVIAKTVCRHSVKANDLLAGPELENLIEDLRQCAMPYTCPHGRPTLIEMNFRELEKKFGRSQ